MASGIDDNEKPDLKKAGKTTRETSLSNAEENASGNHSGKISGSGDSLGKKIGGLKERTGKAMGGLKERAGGSMGGLKEGLDEGPGQHLKEFAQSGLAEGIISGSPEVIALGVAEGVAGRFMGDAVDRLTNASGKVLDSIRPGSSKAPRKEQAQRKSPPGLIGSVFGRARRTLGMGSETVREKTTSRPAREKSAKAGSSKSRITDSGKVEKPPGKSNRGREVIRKNGSDRKIREKKG